MREKLNPLDVDTQNIANYKQNKPILIARDLNKLYGVPIEDTLKILLARGVFKWLWVREALIEYKDDLKHELTMTIEKSKYAKYKKDWSRHQQLKGKIKTLVEVRKEIRSMCHMDRWCCSCKDKYSLWFIAKLAFERFQEMRFKSKREE